ncbi:MAG: hypothetical protein QNK37_19735 [Acidobacteriota bacterium]|nr:hypothetical protein [Acidobacteriota bacterium]
MKRPVSKVVVAAKAKEDRELKRKRALAVLAGMSLSLAAFYSALQLLV